MVEITKLTFIFFSYILYNFIRFINIIFWFSYFLYNIYIHNNYKFIFKWNSIINKILIGKSDLNATALNCDDIHTIVTAQDYFDDLDCDPMLRDMAYVLERERERNFDDPEIKTNDMFTKMLWRIETHTLNLYKKRLVECYRIYLTTKYPSQFETHRKTDRKWM